MSLAPLPATAPLDEAFLPRENKEEEKSLSFCISTKNLNHGLLFIKRHLKEEYNLSYTTFSQLPDPRCVLYWVVHSNYELWPYENIEGSNPEMCPIIARTTWQNNLCQKALLPRELEKYHGEDAWKIMPTNIYFYYRRKDKVWDLTEVTEYFKKNKNALSNMWIFKPNGGSKGKNIGLWDPSDEKEDLLEESLIKALAIGVSEPKELSRWEDEARFESWWKTSKMNHEEGEVGFVRSIKAWHAARGNLKEVEDVPFVLQRFISNPLLWNNKFKWDFRVYVLVACTDPITVYLHRGKGRLCVVPYDTKDFSNVNSFLTNAHIQKKHKDMNWKTTSVNGNKLVALWPELIEFFRSSAANGQFPAEFYDNYSAVKGQRPKMELSYEETDTLVLEKIAAVVKGSLLALSEQMDADGKTNPCAFKFLGLDVLTDSEGKFYLLEYNHSPAIGLFGGEEVKRFTKTMLMEMFAICFEVREVKMAGKRVPTPFRAKAAKNWIPLRIYERSKNILVL